MIRLLFIGDIVSHLGRATVGKILPSLKKKLKIDLCLANGENLAGGRGLTPETVREITGYGVDYLTGGDHTFWRRDFRSEIEALPVLRPINLEDETKGYGSVEIQVGRRAKVTVVSLLGTASTLIRIKAANSFLAMDDFLSQRKKEETRLIVLDFHSELTSEKVALGWHLDGRVSAVLGTHTHVPTSDAWILPQGTAYVTDVGMVGSRESVLGVQREIIINRLSHGDLTPFKWVRSGSAVFNSVLLVLEEKTGRARSIKRLDFVLDSK